MNAARKAPRPGVGAGARSPAFDSILAAAAVAFSEHGYHGMSMRDLARATRRSPATLYNYVDSKEDLLYLIQLDAFEAMVRRAEAALDDEREPIARLRKLVRAHLSFFAEKPYLTRVLLHDSEGLGKERHAQIGALKRRYFELARSVLAESVRARGLSFEPSALDRYTHVFFGMLNASLSFFASAASESAEDLAGTVESIVLEGFSSPACADRFRANGDE